MPITVRSIAGAASGTRVSRWMVPPGRGDVSGEGLGDGDEVDDAGGRGMERRDAPGVWLDLGDLLGAEPPQAGDPVGLAAPLELVEAASSDSSVATTSLPERRWGMSRSSQ